MPNTALLLVDIQNDFCPGGALPIPHGDDVVAVANRLMPRFELVVATQDWHPPNHSSFAANHLGRKVGDVIEIGGTPQILWPVHCVASTQGAALVSGLHSRGIDKIFHKGTDPLLDSYSAFFDNGHHNATGLEDFLKSQQVRTLYIMGLATDYCVKFTALDARALGFETFLIEDGCRGVEARTGDVEAALDQMRAAGVAIIDSGANAPGADQLQV
jgi:nicotinamidase/pyrazinamidase